jgi:hypothetical protein
MGLDSSLGEISNGLSNQLGAFQRGTVGHKLMLDYWGSDNGLLKKF